MLRSVFAIGPPNDRRLARVRPPLPQRIAAHRADYSPNSTDLLAPGRSRIVARTAPMEGAEECRLVLRATGVAPRARRQQENPILRGFSPRRGPAPKPKTAAPGR
jgi:hypothetical protein